MCSLCCVERGKEGMVSCLECLESEFRGSVERKQTLEETVSLEDEMGRTVDWVLRQRNLRGL